MTLDWPWRNQVPQSASQQLERTLNRPEAGKCVATNNVYKIINLKERQYLQRKISKPFKELLCITCMDYIEPC